MNIYFDGKHISRYSLTPLRGTLNALTAPADYKPLRYNENATIDGSRAVITDRRVKKRELSLPFLLTAPNLYILEERKQQLEQALNTGKEIEVKVAELYTSYFFVYDGIKKYNNFDNEGKATVFLKFIELNPRHRINHRGCKTKTK